MTYDYRKIDPETLAAALATGALWCEYNGYATCFATHLGKDGSLYCDITGHDPNRQLTRTD